MAILKVCNYFLLTNYKPEEIVVKFEEVLSDYLEDIDEDSAFNLEFFIEDLIENNEEFDMASDSERSEDIDAEYNEEAIDLFVEEKLSIYEEEETLDDDVEVIVDEDEDEEE